MNSKKQNKNRFLNGNYALLPILFVLCIVPLIMRIHIYYSGLTIYPWYSNTSREYDIFLYYKAILLIITAVLMIFILAFAIYKDRNSRINNENVLRIKQAKWIIPLTIFGLLAFLSTLFSKYRSYGFTGFLEQFESIWVILAYCIIAVYTFYFTKTKADIDVLRKGLFFFLAIICAIGISQLIGHDFWESDLGKSILVPFKYSELKNSLNFEFSGSNTHQVYMTLYNPNYVGVFATLILPICIMLGIGSDSVKKKISWGIMSVAVFLCALGSGSKAFLLALAVIAVIGIFFFIRKKIKFLPIALVGFALFAGLSFAYMTYSGTNLFDYIKNALTPQENSYVVEDFIIEDDRVILKYNGKTISMQTAFSSINSTVYLIATDENGTDISHSMSDDGLIRFEDERFADITIKVRNEYNGFPFILDINLAGHSYKFAYKNKTYTYINDIFKADTMIHAESAIFTKYDRLFSGRGYIWSRSIPLLKDSIILGAGADTFGLVFPHNDYVAKINAGYQNKTITKPHCLYLQSAIQYGIPALICYLTVMIIYIIQTLKLCWKADFKDSYNCLALGVLLGIIGYCIMGISNDSCLAVTPIAWTILGFGYALNYILKKEKAQA